MLPLQQIANYMIIFRLSQGRAWNKETKMNLDFAMPTSIDATPSEDIDPELAYVRPSYNRTNISNDQEKTTWINSTTESGT